MSGSKSSPPAAERAPSPPDEPLALTVHSMPQLDPASAVSAAASRRGRLKMIGVLLVCAAALLLSFLATLYPAWRAARTQPAEALRYE